MVLLFFRQVFCFQGDLVKKAFELGLVCMQRIAIMIAVSSA